jgi:signal peptidase II
MARAPSAAEPTRLFSRLRLGLGLAALVIALDQASKWWIVTRVQVPPRRIEVTAFFDLVLTWNRGVSFSLFSSGELFAPWLLSSVALAICVLLIYWLATTVRGLPAAAIGLVLGGALGNVVDRVRFGAVADFLDFHLGGYHWPAFNLADSAITVGVVLLLADGLFGGRESNR